MWNWSSISHPQKHQDDEVASPKQDPGSPGSVPLATLHWRGITYWVLKRMACIVDEAFYHDDCMMYTIHDIIYIYIYSMFF